MIVILDSGVLSLLTYPLTDKDNFDLTESYQCQQWLLSLLSKGVYVVTSDICDYEVRRELIRIQSEGINELDEWQKEFDFLPITRDVLRKAAEFWAKARHKHQPTADDKNIDADMIIAAQWYLLQQEYPGQGVYIATKNLRHLEIFAGEYARKWMDINF